MVEIKSWHVYGVYMAGVIINALKWKSPYPMINEKVFIVGSLTLHSITPCKPIHVL